ncbi:bifunctional DNA primase/polymerase [Nocardia sp. NBC_01327]|uniref:bifunctional DNA primase/polymerase n=1 Tax=Nocardia sp. NBC_01327 TaxID=2903593 RepID=UPI002E0E35AB|nr:bifunctional DNA primase/polymerase [Nocardia sp. NBC_01327]
MSANRFLDAALSAAARGWYVFPLQPHTKVPAIKDWQHRATTEENRIRDFWPHQCRSNVAIATGPSGLHVIDLDTHHGLDGPATFYRLATTIGTRATLLTYSVATPGGRHLYYRVPGGLLLPNTAARIAPGIDSRGHGGYVVAAGSHTHDGDYRALTTRHPRELPPWLLQLLAPPHSPAPASEAGAPPANPDAYLRAIVSVETRKVTAAVPGTRNTALFRAAFTLGRLVAGGALDQHHAHDVLAGAAAVHIGHQQFTARELERTIISGFTIGARRPRHLPAATTNSRGGSA